MIRIVLFSSEYMTLEYLQDKKIIHHTIHKPVGGQPLRDVLNTGTEALGKYGACKWLSDDRKNGPLSEEDREWGFNDWNRRTIEKGWKYWALVVPQELVDAGTMIPTMEALFTLGLRMMVFTSVEEGMAWLDKMKD
ncbi:MAG: hypothetical protein HY866_05510 [Chloroflexi bacterium]|nr:hypothetical protein [Chloroflexota bacterium]